MKSYSVILKDIRLYYRFIDNLGLLTELRYYYVNKCFDDFNLYLDMLVADNWYNRKDYIFDDKKTIDNIDNEIDKCNNDIDLLIDLKFDNNIDYIDSFDIMYDIDLVYNMFYNDNKVIILNDNI